MSLIWRNKRYSTNERPENGSAWVKNEWEVKGLSSGTGRKEGGRQQVGPGWNLKGPRKHSWILRSNSDGFLLCRMCSSYHRQFFTWLIRKLSWAWKNVVATREVNSERKRLGLFCLLVYLLFGVKCVLVLRLTSTASAHPCGTHDWMVFESGSTSETNSLEMCSSHFEIL